ncbi:MAG: squalene/phytoene synthase family protein [Chthoniobacterales bacterium]
MKTLYFPHLKKVARSFYITIRLLPQKLQEPVALAYLLARASDTIADQEPANFQKSDRDLLGLLPLLLEALDNPRRDSVETDAIRRVWKTILEGQRFDLETFSSQRSAVTLNAEELDHYLYLVAGCVGEFWTTLAMHHLPNYSKAPLKQMLNWGVDYGKGLQLTNILRDRHEDGQAGRFYYSEDRFFQLHAQALTYLQQGKFYLKALRPGRLKMASALPLLLAEQTLFLVANNRDAIKVKVSRAAIYMTLLRTLVFLFF